MDKSGKPRITTITDPKTGEQSVEHFHLIYRYRQDDPTWKKRSWMTANEQAMPMEKRIIEMKTVAASNRERLNKIVTKLLQEGWHKLGSLQEPMLDLKEKGMEYYQVMARYDQ
jgi:hypothetical protein